MKQEEEANFTVMSMSYREVGSFCIQVPFLPGGLGTGGNNNKIARVGCM